MSQSNARPWSRKHREGHSPGQRWDYVVVGSGMGGMTAAAMLAKMGNRVLVLEQHYVPGGFTHAFRRKGWHWDVGVHAVGEVTLHSMTGRLLHQLSDGELEWATLGPVYDEFYYPEGFRVDFPDNPKAFRDNLVDAFPGEGRAIDEFLRVCREASGNMKSYYLARTLPQGVSGVADKLLARKAQRWFETHTSEIVEGLTDDERLRNVFTAQWGYYGSPPERSSFAMQALVTKHFLWGGYYPVGGSARIAETLLGTVAKAGGWTRINADVEEILVDGNKAVGVRLKDGEEIPARRVVSAAGVLSTVQRLLPAPYAQALWANDVRKLTPAPAHVCLYLGFEGDIRAAGAGSANKWFYETWDRKVEHWAVSTEDVLAEAPILYCSFPSLKDPAHNPGEKQRHTGEVVTFVPYEIFEGWLGTRWAKRGEDYEAFKQKLSDHILEHFLRHMPKLRPMIRHAELSTPLSTEWFVRPMAGSIYGLEPTPERFRCSWLRPRAPVDNLFFAGGEITSVGVIGAMMGGVLCAASAEPRGAFSILREVMGRR